MTFKAGDIVKWNPTTHYGKQYPEDRMVVTEIYKSYHNKERARVDFFAGPNVNIKHYGAILEEIVLAESPFWIVNSNQNKLKAMSNE